MTIVRKLVSGELGDNLFLEVAENEKGFGTNSKAFF